MLGFGAIGEFAIGQVGFATAETITVDKWFVPLSEPPRFRLGAKAAAQQVNAFPDPFPFVSFGWFEELSIPAVRVRPGVLASARQFGAGDTAVIPVSRMTPWFVPLSEPARKLPGLEAQRQQAFAGDTSVIPVSRMMPWFTPLSEPPRKPVGVYPPRQQFETRPPQLRPAPGVSARMATIDTKDLFLGGARVFLRVDNAEIGIIELAFTGSQIGIVEMAASTGTSGVIESAAVPATGTPIGAITTAHVSIRIV
jgi:hypothetical protein